MATSNSQRTGRHRRGSAMVMMIVISSILTGLVLTLALAAGVQSDNTQASIILDQANAAAESACQTAVWQFKHNTQWRQATPPSPLPTMTIGANTFTYSATCVDAGNTANLYWPFSEGSGSTTADMSGNGNTGTLIGGVSWTTQGEVGDALVFDGATGYVDTSSQGNTNIVGSVTVSAWVKLNSTASDQKVGGNEDGVSGGYKMSIYGMKAEFEVRDANNNVSYNRNVAGGTTLTTGVWYQVAGVYNVQANTITTYINGVLDRQQTGVEANALASTTGDFISGREPFASSHYFNGTIDQVQVYSTALNASQVLALSDTSVHITAKATLQTPAYAYPPSGSVSLSCSDPPPAPPAASTLVVGGNWAMQWATVTGNVQIGHDCNPGGPSTVNGKLYYGGSFNDSHHYITITYNGNTVSPIQSSSLTVPSVNYTSIQAQATTSYAGNSTNQTFTFPNLGNGQLPIIYVSGDVTNPTINSSTSGGIFMVGGNFTTSVNSTFGSSSNPVYLLCEHNVSQTGGTFTLYGGLYANLVNGNWSHNNVTIYGDVTVGGDISDSSTSPGSTYVNGALPSFDPRYTGSSTQQPIFYTSYHGVIP